MDSPRLLCEEVLYVSDDPESQSHFSLDHVKNKSRYPVPDSVFLNLTHVFQKPKLQARSSPT